MTVPVALTIAGSDPSAGAGIQADLKTFSALGVYGATVITALTAQNTREVAGIEPVTPGFVGLQIDTIFADLPVAAVKIGMVGQAALIEAVADALQRHGASKVVVDPVMVASTGAALLDPDAVEALRHRLIRGALLITPNLPEAAALLGEAVAADEEEMRRQAERLLALGPQAVLIKGGHGRGVESVDLFVDGTAELRMAAPRIATTSTHGTGCTLSAAIAAGLAHGQPLPQAVADAKAFVTRAIEAADRITIGTGHGPVHHFHAWW